jgi:hypothetical protein
MTGVCPRVPGQAAGGLLQINLRRDFIRRALRVELLDIVVRFRRTPRSYLMRPSSSGSSDKLVDYKLGVARQAGVLKRNRRCGTNA